MTITEELDRLAETLDLVEDACARAVERKLTGAQYRELWALVRGHVGGMVSEVAGLQLLCDAEGRTSDGPAH